MKWILIFLCLPAFGQLPVLPFASPTSSGTSCGTPTPVLIAKYNVFSLLTNSAGVSPPSNGDTIKGWGDQSGNGFHLVQLGGATVCPTYHSTGGGSNNTPYLSFNGTTGMMLTNNAINISQTNTYVMVISFGDNGLPGTTRALFDGIGGNHNAIYYDSSNLSWHMLAGLDYSVGFPFDSNNHGTIGKWDISSIVFAKTNSLIMVNGTYVTGLGNPGTQNEAGFTFGTSAGGGLPQIVNVQEIDIYSGFAFCTNEMHAVQAALSSTYGIPIN